MIPKSIPTKLLIDEITERFMNIPGDAEKPADKAAAYHQFVDTRHWMNFVNSYIAARAVEYNAIHRKE
jgi:hypothetical protein